MKKIASVFRERRGSSLLECVISMVIFVLLTTMITTMVTTASRAVGSSEEIDKRIDGMINDLAEQGDTTPGDTGNVTLDFGGGAAIDLSYESAQGDGLVLYKLLLPEEAP